MAKLRYNLVELRYNLVELRYNLVELRYNPLGLRYNLVGPFGGGVGGITQRIERYGDARLPYKESAAILCRRLPCKEGGCHIWKAVAI